MTQHHMHFCVMREKKCSMHIQSIDVEQHAHNDNVNAIFPILAL